LAFLTGGGERQPADNPRKQASVAYRLASRMMIYPAWRTGQTDSSTKSCTETSSNAAMTAVPSEDTVACYCCLLLLPWRARQCEAVPLFLYWPSSTILNLDILSLTNVVTLDPTCNFRGIGNTRNTHKDAHLKTIYLAAPRHLICDALLWCCGDSFDDMTNAESTMNHHFRSEWGTIPSCYHRRLWQDATTVKML
jgi:hypothetical protein